MNSPNGLGARLQAILRVIKRERRYQNVWDCCCDHGYLGMRIIHEDLCDVLHFVDQVPHIMDHLSDQLADQSVKFPLDKYTITTGDASELDFNFQQNHLVVLAGVSGQTVIDIMQGLQEKYPAGEPIDFLLCPTNGLYDVREYLATRSLSLRDEMIVTEKRRHYEVVYLRAASNEQSIESVSLTGKMWDTNNSEHTHYLEKLITHYQKTLKGDGGDKSRQILLRYRSIDHLQSMNPKNMKSKKNEI